MNQSGNNPHAPQSGQTLVQGGQPQYVAASPPGVAVALPNSAQGQAYPQPPYPQGQSPQAPQQQAPQAPQYPQHAQQQQAAPAPAQPSPRSDELMPGAGKTVYEFRGDHSEEARSGGRHQTFFADNASLASVAVTEDRQHSNLQGGGATSWVIGGLVVAIVGGLLAFFLSGSGASDETKDDEEVASVETEPAAPAAAPVEAAPTDAAADPAAAGAAADPAAAGASVEGAQPGEEAKPTEEAKPAEEAEPKKSSSTKKKKSSSSRKKKSEPAKKVPSISPSKPPRSGLDNLPAPD